MEDKSVEEYISSLPNGASNYGNEIRSIIYHTAEELGISSVEESFKWGEPSYKAPRGTPIRMDWKEDSPDRFHIYFNCKSIMVETLKTLYGSELNLIGSREVSLDMNKPIPQDILRHSFSLALNYHDLKHLPLLGA